MKNPEVKIRCSNCRFWEGAGADPPRTYAGRCSAQMRRQYGDLHDYELYHPPYAGGSSFESLDTDPDFFCAYHEVTP